LANTFVPGEPGSGLSGSGSPQADAVVACCSHQVVRERGRGRGRSRSRGWVKLLGGV